MGYSLQVYGLDWQELRAAFGSGDEDLREQVLEEAGPDLTQGLSAAERRRWRTLVNAFVCGRRGQVLARSWRVQSSAGQVETVDGLTALAIVGIIQALGTPLGSLEHSTSAGAFFREEFLAVEAPKMFGATVDFTLLLGRPFFGLTHEEYPSWGGLQRAEIDGALAAAGPDPEFSANDSGAEGWAGDLLDCLQEAQLAGTDVISVYL